MCYVVDKGLDKVQCQLCYYLNHITTALKVCHGINQDQTEELFIAGIILELSCQFHAT